MRDFILYSLPLLAIGCYLVRLMRREPARDVSEQWVADDTRRRAANGYEGTTLDIGKYRAAAQSWPRPDQSESDRRRACLAAVAEWPKKPAA